MPFISEFKRIARSGETIDGRELKPQDLLDMAETYDPNKMYQAKVWYKHWRWFGAIGDVVAVKAQEVEENGKKHVELFAQIQPTSRGIEAIREGNMTHGSVELKPNFSATGKCYLRGLGLTDEPASLATEQFHFNEKEGVGYSKPLEIDWGDGGDETTEFEQQTSEPEKNTLFHALAEFFGNKKQDADMPDPKNEPTQEERFTSIENTLEQISKKLGVDEESTPDESEKRFSTIEETLEEISKKLGLGDESPSDNDDKFSQRISKIEESIEQLLELAPQRKPNDEDFNGQDNEEVFV